MALPPGGTLLYRGLAYAAFERPLPEVVEATLLRDFEEYFNQTQVRAARGRERQKRSGQARWDRREARVPADSERSWQGRDITKRRCGLVRKPSSRPATVTDATPISSYEGMMRREEQS